MGTLQAAFTIGTKCQGVNLQAEMAEACGWMNSDEEGCDIVDSFGYVGEGTDAAITATAMGAWKIFR